MALGDVDSNGFLDILVANRGTASIPVPNELILTQPTGSLSTTTLPGHTGAVGQIGRPGISYTTVIGDVNEDGTSAGSKGMSHLRRPRSDAAAETLGDEPSPSPSVRRGMCRGG